MKRNKNPNISGMIYDDDFSLSYECAGEISCKFTLCEVMPPDEESTCYFREHGACLCQAAQIAAIEALRRKLHGAMKQLEDEA